MLTWFLALQLFAFPVTHAYAVQVKQNVVVSVTYAAELPVVVCTDGYRLDDPDMAYPVDTHCWKPTDTTGEFDTWENERIDMLNFKVTVKYPSGKVDVIALVTKINT